MAQLERITCIGFALALLAVFVNFAANMESEDTICKRQQFNSYDNCMASILPH